MEKLCAKVIKNTRIDYIGLMAVLKRFQRDAHGVRRFSQLAQQMVKAQKMEGATMETILKEVAELGLRITTDCPRKTREAAAFSLWMCVYRPVTFNSQALPDVKPDGLEEFCATLNYFIASSYLGKFGDIELGQTPTEIGIRTERIRRDFTCREVSLSTLEAFYGAILKLKPEYVEHENTIVHTSSFTKKSHSK